MRAIAQREDIRDLILDGVDQLLARYGYRKMTMEDLAKQVGIGKGTIYLHFRSKEELTLSHIDRIAERVLTRMQIVATTGDPFPERIVQMLQIRVLYRFDAVRHYSESLNEPLSSLRKEVLVHREGHFRKEAETLQTVLEAGKAKHVFDHEDSSRTAMAMIWSTNGLLPYSLTAGELGNRKEMERRVTAIATLLISGIFRKRPSASWNRDLTGVPL
jgi:AcrR family transcriptional regulator